MNNFVKKEKVGPINQQVRRISNGISVSRGGQIFARTQPNSILRIRLTNVYCDALRRATFN
jgi:hypothetical protein